MIVPVPRVPSAENLDGDNLPHGPQDPICHEKNHPLTYDMIYEMLAMDDKAVLKLSMFPKARAVFLYKCKRVEDPV